MIDSRKGRDQEATAVQSARPASDGIERSIASSPGGTGNPIVRLYPALGNAHFRLFWLGMLPATLAWQMNLVAAPYAAFTLAGTATVLGIVSLASGIPMLALALVGGVVADRLPRRSVLLGTQSILCAAATALAILSLSGRLEVWHLVVASAVQGSAFAFNMPARQAYIAEIVERPLLRSAVALNNVGQNFTRIAGPAVAGMLLAVPSVGTGGIFATMACIYVVVLVSLFRLPQTPPPVPSGDATGAWEQMLEGLRYVRSSPALVALLAMGFLATFLGMPYQTLLPVFSERVFQVGGGGLGVLMAATGVGAFVGALLVAALTQTSRPALLQLVFGVGFGLALIGFAVSPSFAAAVVLLTLVGFLSSAYASLNNTLVVSNSAPSFYGRVMSVYMLTFAMMPLGALPLAWLADHIGVATTVGIAGGLVATSVAAVALLYPAYRRIK